MAEAASISSFVASGPLKMPLRIALIAVLHWVDYFRDLRPLTSGLINSVPTLAFVLLLVIRPKQT